MRGRRTRDSLCCELSAMVYPFSAGSSCEDNKHVNSAKTVYIIKMGSIGVQGASGRLFAKILSLFNKTNSERANDRHQQRNERHACEYDSSTLAISFRLSPRTIFQKRRGSSQAPPSVMAQNPSDDSSRNGIVVTVNRGVTRERFGASTSPCPVEFWTRPWSNPWQ